MGKRGAASTPPSAKALKVEQPPWVSKMGLILEMPGLEHIAFMLSFNFFTHRW
jgi:hypothetical protein